MIKEGSDVHLSIPVHKGITLGIGLLKKLIAKAGLSNEEYIDLFYRRKKEDIEEYMKIPYQRIEKSQSSRRDTPMLPLKWKKEKSL